MRSVPADSVQSSLNQRHREISPFINVPTCGTQVVFKMPFSDAQALIPVPLCHSPSNIAAFVCVSNEWNRNDGVELPNQILNITVILQSCFSGHFATKGARLHFMRLLKAAQWKDPCEEEYSPPTNIQHQPTMCHLIYKSSLPKSNPQMTTSHHDYNPLKDQSQGLLKPSP